jgi:hypothetical protein
MSFLELAEIKIFFPTETRENRHKFAPHVPSKHYCALREAAMKYSG